MESFGNFKVTVVDEDQPTCESRTQLIRGWGLGAEGFTQPESALKHVRENKCDVVLLCVFIRDVCCLDLIPQFSNDLKIIVTTGLADKDMAVRSLKVGAFDLIEKPFQNELLYHSITRALRTLQNERASRKLAADLKWSRSEILAQQRRLANLNAQLIETNKALSIFAQNIEREREETEKRIALKLRSLVIPTFMRLRNDRALYKYKAQLDILTKQVEYLTSGFAMDSQVAMRLSCTEVRIASLIKNGIATEEIARQLHISTSTVRTHRKNIRKKLAINNAQCSLRNFLNSRS